MDVGQKRTVARFSFVGSAGEYFGIWIVNILLTILTLGIYSAWAKVRRMRYFYGNTFLDRHSFEYHARPLQILVGRIVAFVLIVCYNILVNLNPIAGGIAFLGLVLAFPFLIYRGIRFHARVTSYRNVRFDFAGGYGGAFLAYVAGPFLAMITLGILAPLASRWRYRYLFNNLRYGGRRFACGATIGEFYGVWWFPAMITIGMFVVLGPAVALLTGFTPSVPGFGQYAIIAVIYAVVLIGLVAYSVSGLFYVAGVRNVAFSATRFDGRHRLDSDLSRRRYAWIAISNLLVTVVTFGLARPWAAVRMARYTWASTALAIRGEFGTYISELKDESGVVGAEFMDFEGFDIGF